MATQGAILVLAPIIVEVGRDLGGSVSAVGQARAVLAGTAVLVSVGVGPLIDRLGVRPLLVWGSALGLAGAVLSAAAPSLPAFYVAHAVSGMAVACLLSAGFAGVGAYFGERDGPAAMGYVVAGQSLSWVVGMPLIGVLTDAVSWRLAYVVPAVISLAALAAGLTMPKGRGSSLSLRHPADRTGLGGSSPQGSGLAMPHPAEAPVAPAAPPSRTGLRAVLGDPSARRWAIAELVAYSAWTAELTYAGAFYVTTYDSSESAVGFLLAAGSIAFMISTLGTARLSLRFPRRRLIVGAALAMGALLVVIMNVTPSVWFTLGLFFLMALCAGVRSTGSSNLGLVQLPAQPGSMMAARTAAAQLGYMVGALAGGAVLALSDFGALGFVLFAGMAISAWLVSRVGESPAERRRLRGLAEPVPD